MIFRNVKSLAVLGSILTTFLMLPLISALFRQPELFHWKLEHSAATVLAFLATSLIITISLWISSLVTKGWFVDFVLAFWLLVSSPFIISAVSKLPLVSAVLEPLKGYANIILIPVGVSFLVVMIAMMLKSASGRISMVASTIKIFWPFNLLPIICLIYAFSSHNKILVSDSNQARVTAPIEYQSDLVRAETSPAKGRSVILLFDELSPDFFYDQESLPDSNSVTADKILDSGTVYMNAHLEGGSTAKAIPSLLNGEGRYQPSFFHSLANNGLSVRVLGWYIDYCAELASRVDRCESTSLYNVATLENEWFNPLPIWKTNLLLVPAVGVLTGIKAGAGVDFHLETLSKTKRWLRENLKDPESDVVYAHVNIPHIPLTRSNDPYVVTEASYKQEIQLVNDLIRYVIEQSPSETRLIIMSDHNQRDLTDNSDHERVVLVDLRIGRLGFNGNIVEQKQDLREFIWAQLVAPSERGITPRF